MRESGPPADIPEAFGVGSLSGPPWVEAVFVQLLFHGSWCVIHCLELRDFLQPLRSRVSCQRMF